MGEKIKYFVYALIPSVVINMIQAFAAVFFAVLTMFKAFGSNMNMLNTNDPEVMYNFVMGAMGNIPIEKVMALYMVLTLIIEVLVGVFVFKQRSVKGNIKNLNGKAVGAIALATIGLGIATNVALDIVNTLFPKLMENYSQIMDALGLSEMSALILIIAVIGAPVVEEICYRGMTLYLFEKAFNNKFWIANICQALLFGIVHGNIVQGTYAFIFGLVLGYIRKRYDSLYASVLGHFLFNLFGTVVVSLIYESSLAITPGVAVIVGIGIFAAGMVMMKSKDNNTIFIQ